MKVIVTEEFVVLFITDTVIYQDQAFAVFYEQTTHGPGTHIILVCRIQFMPDAPGYYAIHSATIQFKEACFYCIKFHNARLFCFLNAASRHINPTTKKITSAS